MTQIITIMQLKGGAGKSTTAAAIAQAAAADGKAVLAIDLDPQGDLSFFIGADKDKAGTFELLNGTPAEDLIQGTDQKVYAITGSEMLATVKTASASGRRLRRGITPIKDEYDLIVIDTPATFGELHINALQASTGVIIPLENDMRNITNLLKAVGIIRQIMDTTNPSLEITGAVITRYDARSKLNQQIRDMIQAKAEAEGIPYLMEIRAGIALKEAQSFRESIYTYARNSKPAADYWQLYQKIKGE